MALATNTTPGTIYLNGDLHTSINALAPELTATGVASGTYNFPHIVVDSKGRTLFLKEADLDDVPCATDSSCGIAKVGPDTLDVDIDGIVDIPIATTTSLGRIQPDNNFTINSGLLSLQYTPATTIALGTVMLGANLGIDANGILSRSSSLTGDATTSAKGIVQIGSNIDIAAGVISLANATNTTVGMVKSADSNNITITTGDIDIGNNIATKTNIQTWTAAQNAPMTTFTNVSGTVVLDSTGSSTYDVTANGDITLDSITNLEPNQTIDIIFRLGGLITEYNLTLNPSFFKISGNTVAGHTTLVTCTQITTGGNDYAYTIIQPYMV